jgi:hypothetical protein
MADYLTIDDLYELVGSQKVIQYFDDDLDGSIDDESDAVDKILDTAESIAASKMLNSYNDAATIAILAGADPGFVTQVAWIALELASERRPEFCNDEGWGAFKAQYERAITYFTDLSKTKNRSIGEATAGANANTGGALQPTLESGTPRFTFAPDGDYPTGHGGF